MPWEPLPGKGKPELLAHSLEDVLSRLSGPTAASTVGVFSNWTEIVGDRVGSHSTPLRLNGDTLVVGVADPAWASELSWMESELLARIHDKTGSVDLTKMQIVVEGFQP